MLLLGFSLIRSTVLGGEGVNKSLAQKPLFCTFPLVSVVSVTSSNCFPLNLHSISKPQMYISGNKGIEAVQY